MPPRPRPEGDFMKSSLLQQTKTPEDNAWTYSPNVGLLLVPLHYARPNTRNMLQAAIWSDHHKTFFYLALDSNISPLGKTGQLLPCGYFEAPECLKGDIGRHADRASIHESSSAHGRAMTYGEAVFGET